MIKIIAYILFSIIYIFWIILSLVFFIQMSLSFPANGSSEFKGGLLLWIISLTILGGIILLITYSIMRNNLKKVFPISFLFILILLLTLFLR